MELHQLLFLPVNYLRFELLIISFRYFPHLKNLVLEFFPTALSRKQLYSYYLLHVVGDFMGRIATFRVVMTLQSCQPLRL